MRREIEELLEHDPSLPGSSFEVPCFLDSEDLQNLEELQAAVRRCANLCFLCTTNVLTRPWCLVEIYTAMQAGVPIVPVEVVKPGNSFAYPSDEFFAEMRRGELLDSASMQCLADCGMDLQVVETVIRHVFKRIAINYSPHKSKSIRFAELKELLARCSVPHDR